MVGLDSSAANLTEFFWPAKKFWRVPCSSLGPPATYTSIVGTYLSLIAIRTNVTGRQSNF